MLASLRALAEAPPAAGRWAALMYHELEIPGRALAADGAGYAVYCVTRETFRAQLGALAAAGLRGTSLDDARSGRDGRSVAVTFDDGCETDWSEAAPILCELGFGATFFVVAGWLGTRGHLSGAQLQALARAGFEIGSHGLTHRMLTGLGRAELDEELAGSRARLEDAAGVRVAHLSCPHGRWSRAVAAAALRAGYQTVSTSEVGLNGPRTASTRIHRIAVQRGADPAEVALLARGRGLWPRIARGVALDAGRRILGEGGYAALRERLIRPKGRGVASP